MNRVTYTHDRFIVLDNFACNHGESEYPMRTIRRPSTGDVVTVKSGRSSMSGTAFREFALRFCTVKSGTFRPLAFRYQSRFADPASST
jgi:hypothetical protein